MDLIDRQAAIDAIEDRYYKYGRFAKIEELVWSIEKLPPAQPEQCEDAVSREEVLNCLEWQYPDKTPRTKIMELPPAQPKQRTGKWIYHIDDLFPAESTQECDQCHSEQPLECDDNYCPNCGVKMMPSNAK